MFDDFNSAVDGRLHLKEVDGDPVPNKAKVALAKKYAMTVTNAGNTIDSVFEAKKHEFPGHQDFLRYCLEIYHHYATRDPKSYDYLRSMEN